MAGAAGHNHQMPNEMMMGDALTGIKNYTEGVQQTAQAQPKQTDERNMQVDLPGTNHAEPAHCQIE